MALSDVLIQKLARRGVPYKTRFNAIPDHQGSDLSQSQCPKKC